MNDSEWFWLNGKKLDSDGPWWRESNSSNDCVEMQVLGLHKIPCENYTNNFICQTNTLVKNNITNKKFSFGDECDESEEETCKQGLECIDSQCKCPLGNW